MKKISRAVLLILLLTFSINVKSQSIEKILNKSEKAYGGKKKLKAFHSFQTISKLEEFGSYVADTFLATYKREGKIAIEAHIKPNIIYREGIDGDMAWEWSNPTKPKKQVTGKAFISLYRAARWPNPIRSIKQFKQEGNDVKYKESVIENGKQFYLIELRIKGDSLTRDYYIDAQTYLITKQRDNRPLHPNEVERTVETRYEDYRKVNGIMVAFKNSEWDYKLNKMLTLTELKEIIFKPKLDKYLFRFEN